MIGVPVVLLLALTIGGVGYVESVTLPSEPRVPQASVLYYRDGRTVLARLGVDNRTDVPLSRVPVDVRHAVLAAEDRAFYQHHGISTRGIARALWSNVTRGSGEGASTITQQYARNAFLSQRRTASRKAKEAALSIKIEQRYTKNEIMERYLNTIYLGRGAYGIEAAAHAFFGTTVDRLTVAQGAVLAAQAKSPWGFDPAVNRQAAQERWQWIIKAMVDANWLDKGAARNLTYPNVEPRSPTVSANDGPLGHIVDQVEAELELTGLPSQSLRTDGLKIVTTIDETAQSAALAAIGDELRGQPSDLRSALVAVDPRSGGVRAYYGGDQGRGYYDDAAAPRRPASTFKPLVLAQGLLRGISYLSMWDGSSPRSFDDRMGVPLLNRDNLQCPVCPLNKAMVMSLNTPFYALAERVGPENIRNLAIQLGVSDTYDGKRSLVDEEGAPRKGETRAEISLGTYPVTPADLASVYATLASNGVHAKRHFVQSVSDRAEAELHAAPTSEFRVLPSGVAADVTHVLSGVVANLGAVLGHPAAAKTGTQQFGDSSDNQDAWTAGYTPQLAASVWIGRAQPGPIRDSAGKPIQGDTVPYAIWRSFLTAALATTPGEPLPAAANIGRGDVGDADTTGASQERAPKPRQSSKPASSPRPSTATSDPPPPTKSPTRRPGDKVIPGDA